MRGGICCALRCEVRCEQEKICLTVRGVLVLQRLHDRGKKMREEACETDFMASVRLVR